MNQTKRPGRWVASCRLQLNPLVGFGFRQVSEIIPLLSRVGFSWLYLSPVPKAAPGSNHGYDTRNCLAIDDERGGKAEFEHMLDVAKRHCMHVLWDYTHHQERGPNNPLWQGLQGIPREVAFDIDPVTGENRGFWQHRHLAGLRAEDPVVREHSLRLFRHYAEQGVVAGIRIDASDMLSDVAGFAASLGQSTADLGNGRGIVKIAEVILPACRQIDTGFDGTVGMEMLADLSQVFISEAGRKALLDQWAEVAGSTDSFDSVRQYCSAVHARMTMDIEARRIHRELNLASVSVADIHSALASLRGRTHIDAKNRCVSAEDAHKIRSANLAAPLQAVLLDPRPEHAQAIAHLEQAVVGVNGCGFIGAAFRHGANVGLNDSGNSPSHEAMPVKELHRRNRFRARHLSGTLNTRTTHDTMFSGDVRDVLKTLTFASDDWRRLAGLWFEWNGHLKVGGAPSRKEEYYLYQVLLGAGMVPAERLDPFIMKWLREAGENTGWLDHDYTDDEGRVWHKRDEEYEARVKAFAEALRQDERFVDSLTTFRNKLLRMGAQLTLSQLLILLTAPGMGDVFQGDLHWLYLLVDPDNRCAADWETVRADLDAFEAGQLPTYENVKLWVVWKTLGVRARHERAFAGKAYKALNAPEDVCAFQRGVNVQVWAPVRPGARVPGEVPSGWRNVLAPLNEAGLELDGETVPVSLALLERVR